MSLYKFLADSPDSGIQIKDLRIVLLGSREETGAFWFASTPKQTLKFRTTPSGLIRDVRVLDDNGDVYEKKNTVKPRDR
jgi:hypothetical protein